LTVTDDPIIAAVERLPALRVTVAAAGLTADKRFGQHFLFDLNLTRRIARAAGPLNAGTVIEVGPGPGGLTRALLLEGAQHVVAIEKDRRMVAALSTLVELVAGRLTVIEADALGLDPTRLGPAPYRIIANLPYNVGTPLVIAWLRAIDQYESLTLMFQKEVADRLTAAPGDEAYGRLSVISGYFAQSGVLFDIPPEAFTPPPKVVSSIVQMLPRQDRPDCGSVVRLEQITAAAFGQRRKMLRASLKSLGADTAALLSDAQIEPTARAEELSVAEFSRLSLALCAQIGPGVARAEKETGRAG
jgi:16S rRNA (adenine1518-N6/adenine1519-N6)-dimethyltransferase